MVVNDLNLLWPRGGPPKTDPPLVIDSNAELTPLITFQRLEPVSRGIRNSSRVCAYPSWRSFHIRSVSLSANDWIRLDPIPHNAKRQ